MPKKTTHKPKAPVKRESLQEFLNKGLLNAARRPHTPPEISVACAVLRRSSKPHRTYIASIAHFVPEFGADDAEALRAAIELVKEFHPKCERCGGIADRTGVVPELAGRHKVYVCEECAVRGHDMIPSPLRGKLLILQRLGHV